MATNNYSDNDPTAEPAGKRRNNAALILLVLLLLGSIGFNIYQFYDKEKQEKIMNEELVSSDELRKELQRQLDSTRGVLDEYRGRVEQLDTMITKYEQELIEKKERIELLLKQNKISYNKYIKAKDELDQWKYYANKYLKDIEEKNKKIEELSTQNAELQESNKTQKRAIDTLMDKTVSLTNKISVYSQLKATDILVTGVRYRNNGKERETDRGKNIEKLKICFTIPENKLANAGTRDVFVQILDPRGQTISIEALGSGVTQVYSDQTAYTTKEPVEYDNEKVQKCIYWGKGSEFEEGKYTIKLYTEGYPMGEQSYYIR